MRLFNLDMHIAVIADVRNILELQGIEVVNWSLSGHAWIFGKQQDPVEIVTPQTWDNLTPEIISAFQNRYRDFLSTFDGFIVAFPLAFAMLFEPFNKPIFAVNCVRYDHPFCRRDKAPMLLEFHKCLKRLNDKKLLHVIANNKADLAYFHLGNPTIEARLIPSLCLYTNMVWSNSGQIQFLVYSGERTIPQHSLLTRRSDIGNFNWNDLMRYKGIVHIPYETSTMSIFEHISSGIPLFFPTKRFLKELWANKKAHFQSDYWKVFNNEDTPSYLSETQSYDFWLDNADYYEDIKAHYFDSFDELIRMIDVFSEDEDRSTFLEERKQKVFGDWLNVFQNSPPVSVSSTGK